jgi:putative tricarboxylic transport membrane protein
MFARTLRLITLVDIHILVPAVVSVALVGVYALHSSIQDVVLSMVFGIIGYLMIRYDYPRITLVIALVLGELSEQSFHQSMMMSDNDPTIFLTRGITLFLLLATAFIILTPAIRMVVGKMRKSEAAQ